MLPFPSSRWLYKPPAHLTRINWSNPITRGLSAVLLPNGGPLINYVNGKQWVYRNGSGTILSPIYVQGQFGIALQIGTASQYELNIPIGSNPTDRSFIALHTPLGSWGVGGAEVGISVSGGSGEHIGIKSYTAEEFDGATKSTTPTNDQVSDIGQTIWTALFAASNSVLGVAGVDNHPGSNLNFVEFGTDVAVGNLYTGWSTSPIWAINHPGNAGGTDSDGYFYAYFWTRQLSKAEVIQLYHDPYCILMPPNTWWAGINNSGPAASPFNGAVFENPNPKRVAKDKSYNSPFPINLYGKDTFFGAPGQAPEYTLDKPTKLRSNSRLNYEINTNLGLYFPVTPFIVYEDTRPNRRKTNILNFESNLDLDLITVAVVPFVAYDVDRKFLRRNRNLDWISNTDINLFSVANPFLVTEVTIPRRLLRQFRDFNAPINLNLLGKDTFFGAPGQAPLFDLKNPNTHRSNARLSFEVPITLFNRIPPTPVDDTTALLLFANLHIRLDVKREMDSGNVDALASDVGGTPVTFNKAFLDVDSITLTVAATQPITAIYDFVDVPNPTGFTVYAYDSSGNRVNFTVSWKARGIV